MLVISLGISITTISAQSQSEIPAWVKGVADFWVKGNISDSEFGESISFLIKQNIIQVDMSKDGNSESDNKIINLEIENKKLKNENKELRSLVDDLLYSSQEYSYSEYLDNGCPIGYPYIWSDGFCHKLSKSTCSTGKPYIWSDGFCYSSPEYLDNGCTSNSPYLWSDGYCYTIPKYDYDERLDSSPSCNPSYPDVCIPPYPSDLDCDEIGYSNFRVIGDDPHEFDRDNDGIGCES